MTDLDMLIDVDWPRALRRACSGEGLRSVYQPLVDIQHGNVVGYEALIRFDTLPGLTPDKWFAAAREHGCEPQLEAAALNVTLNARADLPPDCFLSVNIGPSALMSPAVGESLASQPDLQGVVLELTEQSRIDSYSAIASHLDSWRERGALVAIDDAGAGYAGLTHILELSPSILKLDRALISGIDRREANRALVEMMSLFASRINAWVLAEGIETLGELETLRRLGVPLGQGYALGRPSEPWAPLDPEACAVIREGEHASTDHARTVRVLLEQTPWFRLEESDRIRPAFERDPEAYVVCVDDRGAPSSAVTAANAATRRLTPVLDVPSTTPIADAARRALTRPIERRFEPLVCTDASGRLLGMIRMERIVEWLAKPAILDEF